MFLFEYFSCSTSNDTKFLIHLTGVLNDHLERRRSKSSLLKMTVLLSMFEIYSAVIALLIHYSYWTTALNPRHIAPNELFDRWRSKCALQKRGHSYHKIFVTNTISEYKKCNMQMSSAFCGLYVRHTTTQEIFIMQMPLFKKILWTRIHPHIGKSSKLKDHIDNHSKIDMIIHILLTFCAWKKS